jgi:hypothetical protein
MKKSIKHDVKEQEAAASTFAAILTEAYKLLREKQHDTYLFRRRTTYVRPRSKSR